MNNKKYEFVVVGSGAGGVTVARELTKRGKEVLVIERGTQGQKIGSFRHALEAYDMTKLKTPKRSKEGVILWRALVPGGSTVLSCGNSTRCLEEELADLEIELEAEFEEFERETNVAPIPDKLLSECSRTMRNVARDLGLKMEPLKKFVDPVKCVKLVNVYLVVWRELSGQRRNIYTKHSKAGLIFSMTLSSNELWSRTGGQVASWVEAQKEKSKYPLRE